MYCCQASLAVCEWCDYHYGCAVIHPGGCAHAGQVWQCVYGVIIIVGVQLFTQMDVLQPGKFGSFWSFTKKYCAAHWEHFGRRRQWRVE